MHNEKVFPHSGLYLYIYIYHARHKCKINWFLVCGESHKEAGGDLGLGFRVEGLGFRV